MNKKNPETEKVEPFVFLEPEMPPDFPLPFSAVRNKIIADSLRRSRRQVWALRLMAVLQTCLGGASLGLMAALFVGGRLFWVVMLLVAVANLVHAHRSLTHAIPEASLVVRRWIATREKYGVDTETE